MTETCSVEYHNIEMIYTLTLVKQHHFRSLVVHQDSYSFTVIGYFSWFLIIIY